MSALASEEVAHLVAAVVEDERAPVGVRALAGVGVLVQRGAVEAGERPVVAREVRGHPVDDDADAPAVQLVDESTRKSSGVPQRERRREVAGDLVAPRAAERMLHDRHQLDVGEPEVGDVVGELVARARRQSRPRAATTRGAPRRPTPAAPRARRSARARHPRGVVPLVRRAAPSTQSPGRPRLQARDRIGLQAQRAVGA